MLRYCVTEGVVSRRDAQRYIGQRFKIKSELPPWTSDELVCQQLMRWAGYIQLVVFIVCCTSLENTFVFT